jgi:hypothetical protein
VFGYTGSESLQNYTVINNFYYVHKMTMSFSFRGADIAVLGIIPFYWDIQLEFVVYGAQVTFDIDIDMRIRNTTGIAKNDIFEAMNIVILFFSVLSLMFSFRGLVLNTLAFLVRRRQYWCGSVVAGTEQRALGGSELDVRTWRCSPRNGTTGRKQPWCIQRGFRFRGA